MEQSMIVEGTRLDGMSARKMTHKITKERVVILTVGIKNYKMPRAEFEKMSYTDLAKYRNVCRAMQIIDEPLGFI